MSIVGNSIGLGLAQGLQGIAASLSQFQQEQQRLAARKAEIETGLAARLSEIRLQHQNRLSEIGAQGENQLAVENRREQNRVDLEQQQQDARLRELPGGASIAEKLAAVRAGATTDLRGAPGEQEPTTTEPVSLSQDESLAVRRARLGKDAFAANEFGTLDRVTGQFTPSAERTGELRARTEAERELANLRRRTDPNLRHAGGGANAQDFKAARALFDGAQKEEKQARDELGKLQAQLPKALTRAAIDALQTSIRQKQGEIQSAQQQAAVARQRMESFTGDGGGSAGVAPATPSGAVATGNAALPSGVSRADAIALARQAIAGGKDRAAIIRRLESLGIRDSGL